MSRYANGVVDQMNGMMSMSRSSYPGVGDMWAPFVGTRSLGTLGGSERGAYHEVDDMPVAYVNPQFLGSVIEGLSIIDQTYLTTYVLPIEMTTQISWRWSEFQFDQPLPTVVPHEGVPRVVQHSRASKSAHAIRKGIAATFEYDFLTTPDGIEMYVRTMRQIKLAIQRALEIDVFAALLECNEDEQDWQAKNGFTQLDWRDRMEREINFYALFNKDDKGFERWDADVFQTARNLGWEPNMIIVNPECRTLATFGHPERYLYMFAGPNGVSRWMYGPLSLGTMNNLPVFEAPQPSVYTQRDDFPVVRGNITIGEWVPFADKLRHTPNAARHARDRNVEIYDETADKWVEIGFSTLVKHFFRFDENGELHSAHRDLAKIPDNMDIFIAKNKHQESFVTRYWGQVETKYVDETSMKMMVGALTQKLASVNPARLEALQYLYEWFNRTRQTPFSRQFLAVTAGSRPGLAETANQRARAAAAARPMVGMPNELRREGGQVLAGYYGDGWNDLSIVGKTTFLAKLLVEQGPVRNGVACPVTPLDSAPGEVANWYGVELWSARDPKLRESISAVRALYELCVEAFGGTKNPVLDPANCPRHLRKVVREENLGLCTFVERTIFSGVAPLVFTPDPANPPATANAETYAVNVEEILKKYDDASAIHTEQIATGMQGHDNAAAMQSTLARIYALTLLVGQKLLSVKSDQSEFTAGQNAVAKAPLYLAALMSAGMSLADMRTRVSTLVRRITDLARAARSRVDFEDMTEQDLEDLLRNDTFYNAVSQELVTFGTEIMQRLRESGDQELQDFCASIDEIIGQPIAQEGKRLNRDVVPNVAEKPFLLPFVCHSIEDIQVGPNTYSNTLSICDPRTGFATYFSPTTDPISDATFSNWLNRVPSSRWLREGASIDKSTVPAASEYDVTGARGYDAVHERGYAAANPMAQQYHDADRNTFDRDELTGAATLGDVNQFVHSPAFKERYDRAIERNTVIDMGVRLAFCFTWINEPNMVRMAECEWAVKPWSVVGVRPRDTHEMGGALVLKGGPQLGKTYVGHVNGKQGEDPVHKMVLFNFTFYHRSVVVNSKWVVRSDNLYYLRYVGGQNTTPADFKDLVEWHQSGFEAPTSREQWSIMYFLVPHTETFNDKFLDLRGYAVGEEANNYMNPRDRARPHYSTAAYYNALFNFQDIRVQAYGMKLFWGNSGKANSMCLEGASREFNPISGKFDIENQNKGHHGPLVGPGVARVRNGACIPLKQAFAPMGPGWARTQ